MPSIIKNQPKAMKSIYHPKDNEMPMQLAYQITSKAIKFWIKSPAPQTIHAARLKGE
jgi:hypothetical protein